MLAEVIVPKINSQTFSKIVCGDYLRTMTEVEGYSVQRAICEWFHFVKLKTHGKFPSVRNMKIDRAIDAITKLMSVDKQSVDDIVLALNVALTDNFWKETLLTVGQLRVKSPSDGIMRYERLLAKIKTEENKNATKPTTGVLELL